MSRQSRPVGVMVEVIQGLDDDAAWDATATWSVDGGGVVRGYGWSDQRRELAVAAALRMLADDIQRVLSEQGPNRDIS